ncbi:hypothetical protein [Ligilactobacillus agilis]|uniref:hypothetical protein n=1 Tax=Ligilactobacillus agilis TaxID=1601 RepID=UPI0019579302|nr:hypothetical protein [Ligilactobacillus agilis]MBM6763547.1 hypothetical protein [Ligilactobacillus agilis]
MSTFLLLPPRLNAQIKVPNRTIISTDNPNETILLTVLSSSPKASCKQNTIFVLKNALPIAKKILYLTIVVKDFMYRPEITSKIIPKNNKISPVIVRPGIKIKYFEEGRPTKKHPLAFPRRRF